MQNQKPINRINFQELRQVMRTPTIPAVAKCVLIDLLLYAGIDGEAFPSQSLLAKNLGYSDRHIRTQLNILHKNGLVVDWKQRGYSKSNQYTINPNLYADQSRYLKSTSPHVGTTDSIQAGNLVPPKGVSKDNHIISNVIAYFKQTNNAKYNDRDISKLQVLIMQYSPASVSEAIKVARSRNLSYVKVGLIERILIDRKNSGDSHIKPIFQPCGKNGCNNGYLPTSEKNLLVFCACREAFEISRKTGKGESRW